MDAPITKLAVLGTGKMGQALVAGLLGSGWRKPDEITATARSPERISELAGRYGIETTLDNAAAVAGAEVIVLAVKPQDLDALLSEIADHVTVQQTILSVVAAIPTTHIESHLSNDVPVVRAMPNTPSVVHEGVAGIAGGRHAEDKHVALAAEGLTHVGRVVIVPESYLDAVTAISGSGPARFR